MNHQIQIAAAAAALGAACAGAALSQESEGAGSKQAARPGPEYGDVSWGRDLDVALTRSAASRKPVMLLFQEVPG